MTRLSAGRAWFTRTMVPGSGGSFRDRAKNDKASEAGWLTGDLEKKTEKERLTGWHTPTSKLPARRLPSTQQGGSRIQGSKSPLLLWNWKISIFSCQNHIPESQKRIAAIAAGVAGEHKRKPSPDGDGIRAQIFRPERDLLRSGVAYRPEASGLTLEIGFDFS